MNDEEKYFYLVALDYRIYENDKTNKAEEIRELVADEPGFACPLCDAFWIVGIRNNCSSCPADESGDDFCNGWMRKDLKAQRRNVARRKGLWVK